jgi:hypothetical protein
MTGNQIKSAVYHGHIKGHHANRQSLMVMRYIHGIGQPQTVRMLHRIMNARGYMIDLVSLRRAVTNLTVAEKGAWTTPRWLNPWGRQVLRVAFTRPCPITGKTVGWYEMLPANGQTELPFVDPTHKSPQAATTTTP